MRERIRFERELQQLGLSAREYDQTAAVLVVHLEKVKIRGYAEASLQRSTSGTYESYYTYPITGPQSSIVLTGRLMVEESGGRRNYDLSKDAKTWPLSRAKVWSPVAVAKDNGPSSSGAGDAKIKPDGTFTTSTVLGINGAARQLKATTIVELKGGKRYGASVVLELIDLPGFLAIVNPKEAARPASQSRLEFLASVRKVFQGGPNDPLAGAFDQVLYRNRHVKPLFTPGSAEEKRLLRYTVLYAGGERLDIGHVLTGIEGALKQEPNKDQNVPVPLRPDLIVTWSGDLGSSLQKYIKDFVAVMDRGDPIDLNSYLVKNAGRADLIGDIDGVNVGSRYNPARSLAENLNDYYDKRSRRRYHEFISNSLDTQKKPALPLKSKSKPRKISEQGKKWIAQEVRNYLVPFWVTGRLYGNIDDAKKKVVDSIVDADSPEMGAVVDYFVQFLEDGLAHE